MEAFLAQCHSFLDANPSLWLSVMLAGLVGGATHCSLMCSPMVAAQMFDLKHRQQNSWIITWYHGGRIATYSALGVIASTAGQWVFSGKLEAFCKLVILAAGLLFIISAFSPKKTHKCCSRGQQRLLSRITAGAGVHANYLIRGLLMGFMPCGMVISVLLLASTTDSAAASASLMLLFGLCTLPALQSAGLAALSINKRYPALGARLSTAAMTVNGGILCAIGLGGITIH